MISLLSRQLGQCIVAGWIPALKGVFHSQSNELPTQHGFRVRHPTRIAIDPPNPGQTQSDFRQVIWDLTALLLLGASDGAARVPVVC